MTANDKLETMQTVYRNATECSDHPDCVPWKLDDVVKVLHAHWESPDGSSKGAAVVRLKNRNFGTVTEWGDTTGHG